MLSGLLKVVADGARSVVEIFLEGNLLEQFAIPEGEAVQLAW